MDVEFYLKNYTLYSFECLMSVVSQSKVQILMKCSVIISACNIHNLERRSGEPIKNQLCHITTREVYNALRIL